MPWECLQCGNTVFNECDDGYRFCDGCGCSADAEDADESATDLEERLYVAMEADEKLESFREERRLSRELGEP